MKKIVFGWMGYLLDPCLTAGADQQYQLRMPDIRGIDRNLSGIPEKNSPAQTAGRPQDRGPAGCFFCILPSGPVVPANRLFAAARNAYRFPYIFS